MKKQNGFTLIELLVVISVIALLVAILMPALNKARAQAKGVVCLSNLRQVGLAIKMYADDNDDYVPRNTGHASSIWILLFLPYVGHESDNMRDYREVDIYNCPSFPNSGFGREGISNAEQTVDYVQNSWADNIAGGERANATRLSNFSRPAGKIYLADNENGPWRQIIRNVSDLETKRGRFDVWHPRHLPGGFDNERRVAATRHRAGCNNLFLDGHSNWLASEDNLPRMWVEN
ncbi:MAG: DUF1559 domain-containing protein [Phycisphaerae bacterium]|nr:DUF1559 domain-containing protein [Phycisphaerae bacterium]